MEISSRPTLRRSVVVFAAAGFAVVAAGLVCIGRIPEPAMTLTAMTETSVRIGLFVDLNKKLPPNLDGLPRRDGYANRVTDGWNRPLIYAIVSEDRFTLKSLGRDGAVGGSGVDADTLLKYQFTNGHVREVP